MDWFDLNLNGSELDKQIENHPLSVFTKLYADDKNNRVYKECLENEIETAINQLSKETNIEMIMFFKNILDKCDMDEKELNQMLESYTSHYSNEGIEEFKMKIYVTRKIINGVYDKMKQENNND